MFHKVHYSGAELKLQMKQILISKQIFKISEIKNLRL